MTFAENRSGMDLSFAALGERDIVRLLFSEKPALVLQVEDGVRTCEELKFAGVDAYVIGDVNFERRFRFAHDGLEMDLLIDELRDTWFKTSYLLDRRQSGAQKASERFANYKNQELRFRVRRASVRRSSARRASTATAKWRGSCTWPVWMSRTCT